MADLKISQLTGASTPLAGTEVLPIVQSSSTKKVAVSDLTAGRTVAMRNADLTGGAAVINIGATADNTYHYVRTIDNDGQAIYFGNDNAAGSFFGAGAYGRVLYSEGAKPLKVFVNGAYRAEYDTSGNYKLDTGNLVQGTAAKGINFTANTPAAGMTSQLLNWYEEGTFTPSLVPGTSGSITLTTAAAKYTRIGRAVTVTGICEVSSVSSPVGALLLQGLPFTNSADASSRSAAAIYATGLAAGATTSIVGRIIPSESQIRIEKFSAGSASAMAGDVQTNTIIQFNLTYFV
jgi:hypothetical protein